MNHKDFKTIQELYDSIYESQQVDENRRAARAAGGFVDDSKKQTDPSKEGFTGISGSIKDIMRQNKEIEAENKKKMKKEELEATGLFTVEEIEHFVELSTDTLKSYMDKAEKDVDAKLDKARRQENEARFKRSIYKDKEAKKLDKNASNNRSKAGKRDSRIDQAYVKVRKADGAGDSEFATNSAKVPAQKSIRKEDLEATGLFSGKEIEAIMEAEMSEGYKEIDAKKHGRMYDRYKKLSKAAMQDARDSGEASGTNRMKMGKMSVVIDKSSENLRKKQTKDQLTGRG